MTPPTAPPVSPDTRTGDPAAPHRPVIGDGTNGASRARARWRRWRWPLALVALIAALALAAAFARPAVSGTPVAPDNPTPGGARALARVLADHGVEVEYVDRIADAVRGATPGTTLLVVDNTWLDDDQLRRLRETEADLVLVRPYSATLDALTDGDVRYGSSWSFTSTARADCDDPDALAAGRIETDGGDLEALSDDYEVCFPGDEPGLGSYVVGHDGDRTIRIFSEATPLLNASIAQEGNAALALRALGHHERLTWYVPAPIEFGRDGAQADEPSADLPPWTTPVFLQLILVAVVAMFWRGRRFGPLVTEDLPVVVRAAETTRGRGRLYRKAKARGHAAAGLRAATADRIAHRLGLARSSAAPTLIDAIAQATGRPGSQIAELLYGPPPTDDAALLELARHLDQIESEVHHP